MNTTPNAAKLNTEAVVAILRAACLKSEVNTARTKRDGYRVRDIGHGRITVTSDTMDDASWSTAMVALEAAGLVATYRHDIGRGSRWVRGAA